MFVAILVEALLSLFGVTISGFWGFVWVYFWCDISGVSSDRDKGLFDSSLIRQRELSQTHADILTHHSASAMQRLPSISPRIEVTSVLITPERCPLHLHPPVFIEVWGVCLQTPLFSPSPPDRGEPDGIWPCLSAGNKCKAVIMRNEVQSRPGHASSQPPSCFVSREFSGNGSFVWKALSVRGIAAGLAAGI